MRIFAGEYKGRALKTTTGPGFRPAMGKVREALFSILESQGLLWAEASILDLFAGSGSLGFEALSRGAAHVTFVDVASYATKVIQANANLFEVLPARCTIVCKDVKKFLNTKTPRTYDLIFIDPPYSNNVLKDTLKSIVDNGWGVPGTLINAEIESKQQFDPALAGEHLTLLTNRTYGQTRVLVWEINPL